MSQDESSSSSSSSGGGSDSEHEHEEQRPPSPVAEAVPPAEPQQRLPSPPVSPSGQSAVDLIETQSAAPPAPPPPPVPSSTLEERIAAAKAVAQAPAPPLPPAGAATEAVHDFEATFPAGGLGIILEEAHNGDSVFVKGVVPNGAADSGGVATGQQVVSVNGEDTRHRGFAGTLALIKASARPMNIGFVRAGSAPPAASCRSNTSRSPAPRCHRSLR